MTEPFKLRVLHALTDALEEITIANGYHHDMGRFDRGDGVLTKRVYRGRAWFGDNDPIPMISVLEGVSPADEVAEMPVNTATGEFDWPLIVQVFVNDDPENPTDPAYRLMADVRRCLSQESTRRSANGRQVDPLGMGFPNQSGVDRIVSMRIGPGVCRPADDVSARAYGWLTLILRIVDHADSTFA